MSTVPDRVGPPAASTTTWTVPEPDPLAPWATLAHGTLLAAVHGQPAPLATETFVVPPPASGLNVDGVIEYVQPCDCVTENRWPPAVIVPVRGEPEKAATSKFTVPLPVPLPPERMTIQLWSAETVHEHCELDARTWKLPDPPDWEILADASESEIEQSLPACVTAACLSLSAMTPRRLDGSGFDAATNSTEPSPCPLAAPRIVSHAEDDEAVHAHSRAADTVTRPLPPDAGTLMSEAPSVTPHCGTVAGAVDVVEEEPQAAEVRAPSSVTRDQNRGLTMGVGARVCNRAQ
jgi:hypothetical protein